MAIRLRPAPERDDGRGTQMTASPARGSQRSRVGRVILYGTTKKMPRRAMKEQVRAVPTTLRLPRAVIAVRQFLELRAVPWQEIDARYHRRVFVRKAAR